MWNVKARDRLCREIMGQELDAGLRNPANIVLPIHDTEITAPILMAALEAVYTHTPAQTRQMLPFVLHVLEQARWDLIETGYVGAFIAHICADFHRPVEDLGQQPRYVADYRAGWIAPQLSALSRFEQGWVLDWAQQVLQSAPPDLQAMIHDDLTMLCRVSAMALGHPECDAPPLGG